MIVADNLVERIATHHKRERRVPEGKRVCLANLDTDVVLPGATLLRQFDHPRREVDPGDVADQWRQRGHNNSWAAGDIERPVLGPWSRRLDQQRESLAIVHGPRRREALSLSCELVAR